MSDTTRMTDLDRPVRTIRLGWTSALLAVSVVLGFLVLRSGFVAAHRILGWTAASVAVALFLEPIIEALDRFMPRALAVVVSFLVILFVVGGVVFGAVRDLDREVERLKAEAPSAIQDLEGRDDELGRLATDINLSERADTFLDALDDRVGTGEGALVENATSVPVYFVSAILTIFFLVYGPGIAAGAAGQIDDRRRQVATVVLTKAAQRARRTVGALLLQGAVVGVVVAAVAAMLDLPAPIVLGLIAATAGTIPDVGILLGALPTVALTAAFSTNRNTVIILASAFAFQAVEALVVRRQVNRFGVRVGPSVVWIVALIGYTIYGPGMAFFGVCYAIFALAVLDQLPAVRGDLDELSVTERVGSDPTG